ncbi:MAG: helix-turn-helix transcriptional regulator [Nocardioides sp.]|uniref:helix-turn-helix domain-containing protein n=1 Tax=Nocardioides sp. TaxID=35761 RepID=UPI0039E48143
MNDEEAAVLRHVGLTIKAERARRDWTQEKLAHDSGLSVSQIARMERGLRDAGVTRIVRVAWALGIDPAVLLGGLSLHNFRNRNRR